MGILRHFRGLGVRAGHKRAQAWREVKAEG